MDSLQVSFQFERQQFWKCYIGRCILVVQVEMIYFREIIFVCFFLWGFISKRQVGDIGFRFSFFGQVVWFFLFGRRRWVCIVWFCYFQVIFVLCFLRVFSWVGFGSFEVYRGVDFCCWSCLKVLRRLRVFMLRYYVRVYGF